MALNNKKQSTLEKKAIEERQRELVRSDYNKSDAYSDSLAEIATLIPLTPI